MNKQLNYGTGFHDFNYGSNFNGNLNTSLHAQKSNTYRSNNVNEMTPLDLQMPTNQSSMPNLELGFNAPNINYNGNHFNDNNYSKDCNNLMDKKTLDVGDEKEKRKLEKVMEKQRKKERKELKRQLEKERQREAEKERERQAEQERQRQAEQERQQQAEKERQRQVEKERRRKDEKERLRQAEKERQREAEKKQQRKLEKKRSRQEEQERKQGQHKPQQQKQQQQLQRSQQLSTPPKQPQHGQKNPTPKAPFASRHSLAQSAAKSRPSSTPTNKSMLPTLENSTQRVATKTKVSTGKRKAEVTTSAQRTSPIQKPATHVPKRSNVEDAPVWNANNNKSTLPSIPFISLDDDFMPMATENANQMMPDEKSTSYKATFDRPPPSSLSSASSSSSSFASRSPVLNHSHNSMDYPNSNSNSNFIQHGHNFSGILDTNSSDFNLNNSDSRKSGISITINPDSIPNNGSDSGFCGNFNGSFYNSTDLNENKRDNIMAINGNNTNNGPAIDQFQATYTNEIGILSSSDSDSDSDCDSDSSDSSGSSISDSKPLDLPVLLFDD